jgi:HPt (histidine-containing phosphotransfer) domain-containing protein
MYNDIKMQADNYNDNSDNDMDIDEVIDWDEAMEQCGGDGDFLLELLGDLLEELMTQLRKIEIALNPVILLSIRSAAHVVKGAAANLMCEPLRAAAYGLEMVAKSAPPNEPVTEQIRENLQRAYEALQEAARNYKKFVDNQDI